MATVDEFRLLLRGANPLDIVDNVLLANPPVHVTPEKVAHIGSTLADSYGVASGEIRVIITGSAALGFSLVEKKIPGEGVLPRYREFSGRSDIDVAIVSEPIFNLIWLELSGFFHRSPWFPPDSKRLGDYLVCGWLRPDHFPKGVRLRKCDKWWDTFKRFSRDSLFERRRVSGGVFNSVEHLRLYMSRAVNDCIQIESENEDRINK